MTDLGDQSEGLARRGDADSVRDAHPIDAERIDGCVDAQEIGLVASKGILTAEADLNSLAPNVRNNLSGRLDDVLEVFAVTELAENGRGAEENVDAGDTGIHRDFRVLHGAAGVSEYLEPQVEPGDNLGISIRAGRRGGRRELEILDAKIVECERDLNLLAGREARLCELLPFPQGRIDKGKLVDWHAVLLSSFSVEE